LAEIQDTLNQLFKKVKLINNNILY
jgi:hypothetical protein